MIQNLLTLVVLQDHLAGDLVIDDLQAHFYQSYPFSMIEGKTKMTLAKFDEK